MGTKAVKLNYVLFGIGFRFPYRRISLKIRTLSLRNVGKLNFNEIVGLSQGNTLSPIFMHIY